MKKNILLTGGQGFVGSNLYLKLVDAGYNVTVYDLCDTSRNDITDKFNLERTFLKGNFHAVIHLAAKTGALIGDEFPEVYIDTNIVGTNNIVQMCKKHKVDNLIFYSSSGVLGGDVNGKGLKEDSSISPKTLYGVTKAAGELLVKASGLNYVIVRPFTVYGELNGRRDMVIYKWIDQIKSGKAITFFGDGDTTRGYTYIEDITNATVKLVEMFFEGWRAETVINIGGSEIVSLEKMFSIFCRFCERHEIVHNVEMLPLSSNDIKDSYADTTYAKNLIGFSPSINMFEKRLCNILKSELIK